MNEKSETSSTETDLGASRNHSRTPADTLLRKWAIWTGVAATAVFTLGFAGFMGFQFIWGGTEPANWVLKLIQSNWAAMIGTPLSALTAFCIVNLLKVTNGPIEFEAIGFKFRGASGPIVLWVLCFIAVVLAFRLLWAIPPNHALQRTGSAVTAPAADHYRLSAHRQVPRPLNSNVRPHDIAPQTGE